MNENAASCCRRVRRTRFIELLRTTPSRTVCPNFYVLAHANGCRFQPSCAYCYLKASLWHEPKPVVFTNVKRLIREVHRWIRQNHLECYMLNAGNLCDSLSFETLRPLAGKLVEVFRKEAAGRPHTLLFVTKGGRRECADLLRQPPCPNVVVSFSVNHPLAAARYEKGAASVADRFAAARALRQKGWRVRIRIDPMIVGYRYESVARTVKSLKPEGVTLGSLRAEPSLLRFAPHALFRKLEPSPVPAGLARYPLETRLALYRPAVRILRDICPLGLCEEGPEVWNALGLDRAGKTCNCCVFPVMS